MPTPDLRSRLKRLRVQRARRELPPSVPPSALKPRAALAPGEGLPGEEMITSRGAFHLISKAYPVSTAHGAWTLAAWLERNPATAAGLVVPAADELDLRSLVFMDIETTGLAGGTGTLAFLIGAGTYQGDEFVLRQYFLRDPD